MSEVIRGGRLKFAGHCYRASREYLYRVFFFGNRYMKLGVEANQRECTSTVFSSGRHRL